MKKIILSILVIYSSYGFAQNVILTRDAFSQGTALSAMVNTRTGKSLTYSEVAGSPYVNVNFSMAKIAENYEKIAVRYNSYADQIEFERNGSIMVLPKETLFSRIEIETPKQTIVNLETNDELSGYFYEIVNGKVALYKKVKTIFIDTKPASNSYSTEEPAHFKLLDPIFYIKNDKGYIKKPRNQKEIIAQFPDKKDVLNVFFKENKIKFDKEDDLKKLVSYLNKN
ncbi:hypothetical protein SAMN05421857_1658 [Chryseobacterium formosense]|uniref:hypothetical protein n=1 Tax=Chryseobacterium formosense TaxID=236814 RepID=UPI0008E0118F|nr:hypothetical protein [Chryseobacterium formosense]SFT56446.1 hypothetical protein SAMN05421857_1658 [Chryseobacterium formosense]